MENNMDIGWRILVLGLVLSGFVAGCERAPAAADSSVTSDSVAVAPSASATEEVAAPGGGEAVTEVIPREHYYSPFLITTDTDVVFKTITFTDVGIRQPEPGRVDDTLLETIAESLAYYLAQSESLNYTPKVHYDEALADPDNHLFCEEHHLYVALWKGYAPDRWGYSLWSGCNEEHQFAWKEVLVPAEAEDDLIESVKPLTVSIVESLALATKKDCFLATCQGERRVKLDN